MHLHVLYISIRCDLKHGFDQLKYDSVSSQSVSPLLRETEIHQRKVRGLMGAFSRKARVHPNSSTIGEKITRMKILAARLLAPSVERSNRTPDDRKGYQKAENACRRKMA
jgi:hypothetical protein